ncbi:hypothetical protein [Ornithinimicrobium kibberense]|uniref:hypothetical protein n=1 Tax=Ornithinimicrobium kibberense TaxID=282060 RepID=UPI00361CD71C
MSSTASGRTWPTGVVAASASAGARGSRPACDMPVTASSATSLMPTSRIRRHQVDTSGRPVGIRIRREPGTSAPARCSSTGRCGIPLRSPWLPRPGP